MSNKNGYWLSWQHPTKAPLFTLHTPWWISGYGNGYDCIVAAVQAETEEAAKQKIINAYDSDPGQLHWRFCNEHPESWTPFGSDRFPQASWMKWPDQDAPDEAFHLPDQKVQEIIDARFDTIAKAMGRQKNPPVYVVMGGKKMNVNGKTTWGTVGAAKLAVRRQLTVYGHSDLIANAFKEKYPELKAAAMITNVSPLGHYMSRTPNAEQVRLDALVEEFVVDFLKNKVQYVPVTV